MDQAAQTYRVREVRIYGLVLWDSGWYGGNLPLGYSVMFPLLGAVVGLAATGAAAAFAASLAFDRLTRAAWGRRSAGSWYFSVCTLLQVAIGQLPFLTGEAFSLLALVALLRRRTFLAAALAALAALCSPLAAAFGAMACLAWALDRRDRRAGLLTTAGVGLALVIALGVVFPGTGAFPFFWGGLVLSLLLCATVATPLVRATPVLRWGALLYAGSSVASFVIPNPLGGNAPRLAGAVGVPLLVCLLTVGDPARATLSLPFSGGLPGRLAGRLAGGGSGRWRARVAARWRARVAGRLPGRRVPTGARHRSTHPVLAAVLIGGFVVWQWAPGLNVLASPRTEAASSASYYQPVLDQILARSDGPVRVEAVPTRDHWEAAYLAPKVSLARGWERQLDLADNPVFYRTGALTVTSYATWLHRNGVTWVALPDTTLDYAAIGEARLLDDQVIPGVRLVWSSPQWRLWRVAGGAGLLSGPGRLDSLGPDHLSLTVERAAVLTVRVRYTSYWHLPDGGSDARAACIRPGPDGWTDVVARHPGPVRLDISVFQDNSANCAQGS